VAAGIVGVAAVLGLLNLKTIIRAVTGGSETGRVPEVVGVPARTRDSGRAPAPSSGRTKEIVRTTVAELSSSSHPRGTEVRFRALVYPASVVRVTGGMGFSGAHFALVMEPDAAVFGRLRNLRSEVNRWLDSGISRIESAVEDDERFIPLVTEFDEFLREMHEAFLVEPSAKAVALELKGFGRVANQTEWRSVIREGPPSLEDIRKRFLEENPIRRPNVPDLPKLPTRPPSAHEIIKLRKEAIAEGRVSLLVRQSLLRRILAQSPREFSAVVAPPVDIAARTFAEGGQLKPRVFLHESGLYESTFAALYYATTDILITSIPSGAKIRRNGATIGRTPHVVPGLEVGGRLEVELSLEGHEKQSRGIDVDLSPDGIVTVNTMLWPVEK